MPNTGAKPAFPLRELFREPAAKRLAAFFALLLLCAGALFCAGAQLGASRMRGALLARESAVAGSLVRTGAAAPRAVADAFAARKTLPDDRAAGLALFAQNGYEPATADLVLPALPALARTGLLAAGGAAAVLLFLFLLAALRELRGTCALAMAAQAQAAEAGRGHFGVRMEQGAEGAFGRMQHAFNEMAAGVQAATGKLERERAFLSDLLTDISHQLKTPLAALKMINEILLQEPMSKPAREFTVQSGEQLERMEWLILGLLKMARIEADRLTLHLARRSLRTLASEVLGDFAALSKKRDIALSLAAGPEPFLLCDAAWLREAVGNVVKNCIEATPPGGCVTVELLDSPASVSLTVRDTGPGIPPEALPFLFRRFYRAPGRTGNGSGIGLPLARAITEQMGGTLSAGNKPGSGAVFTFLFPRNGL